jgi:plasmid maintenance system antidote protein VapI
MKPADYLDAVKARLNIESDYELAKRLNIPRQGIPAIRKGDRAISLDVAFKIAITLEIDPATVVADLESQREKNPARRAFWDSFTSHARAAVVLVACMLAWSFSGISEGAAAMHGGFFRRWNRA